MLLLKSAKSIANAIIPSAMIIHIKLSSENVELAFALGVVAGLPTVTFATGLLLSVLLVVLLFDGITAV